MSFSAETKDELARVIPQNRCCQVAELAALVRIAGTVRLGGDRRPDLVITTEHAGVARCSFTLFKEAFSIHGELSALRQNRLRKSNTYRITVSGPEVRGLLDELGVLASGKPGGVAERLIARPCCLRAYLRGVFLACGFVSRPEGSSYHLELLVGNEQLADELCALINGLKIGARVAPKKDSYQIYLKDADEIADFLRLIGAYRATLAFENARVVKGMRNQVNRLVNCETANLNKTVSAAIRQREAIERIRATVGLQALPEGLREVARLRLARPEASLSEIGRLLHPPVGKSGVNHRLRRLEEIAARLGGDADDPPATAGEGRPGGRRPRRRV